MQAVIWGSVADWVAAIGTGGALLATIWLLRQELSTRRLTFHRERRAQAEQVAAWTEFDLDRGIALVMKNASGMPIYSVRATAGTPAGHDSWQTEVAAVTLAPGEAMRSERLDSESPTGAVIFYDLEFNDSAGVGWRRGADGDLQEVEPLPYLGCS